jgi:hypothetical protein
MLLSSRKVLTIFDTSPRHLNLPTFTFFNMPVKVCLSMVLTHRTSRLSLRMEDPELDIVLVNISSCESAAYLAKYDSVHGTWNKTVKLPRMAEFLRRRCDSRVQ